MNRDKIEVSVVGAGSVGFGTALIFFIIWAACVSPYSAMRQATLEAVEAEAYHVYLANADRSDVEAKAALFAKQRKAFKAYERLPFFVKWFSEHPDQHMEYVVPEENR